MFIFKVQKNDLTFSHYSQSLTFYINIETELNVHKNYLFKTYDHTKGLLQKNVPIKLKIT